MGILGRDGSKRKEDAPSSATAEQPRRRKPPLAGLLPNFSALSVYHFRMLWLGAITSLAANQFDMVARPWLAYELSGSATTLGLVALARGLPQLATSFIAGTVADRFDKRKVLIVCQAALGIITLTNAVLVHLGVIEVWHLIVLGILQGAFFPFNFPTRQSYFPELVGQKQMPNAIAADNFGKNINRVISPSIAGLLIGWNPTIAFYCIALLYIGGILLLVHLPKSNVQPKHGGAIADSLYGLQYLWNHPVLRALMALAFISVLLGSPVQQMFAVFQADVLHVGPTELGMMYAIFGIGSLVGSLAISYFTEHRWRKLVQVCFGITVGLSLLAFALSTSYVAALAILFIFGAAWQGFLTMNGVLMMVNCDRKLYGRVMGVYMMTFSLMSVATLPMGGAVDLFGAPLTTAVSGGLMAVLVAGAAVRHRDIWRREESSPAR